MADLTSAEARVLRAVEDGAEVDLRIGQSDVDDPSNAAHWGSDRQVRSSVLVDALTGARTPGRRRFRLSGARIVGTVDLQGARLDEAVRLRDCFFEEPVSLVDADIPVIRIDGCHLPRLEARGLTTRGDVDLRRCRAQYVELPAGRIGGSLRLDGTHLDNSGSRVFHGGGLRVADWLSFDGGFSSRGQVWLVTADIGRGLTFTGATLSHPGGNALDAQGIHVGFAMFLGSTLQDSSPMRVDGGIRINGAVIDDFLCGWNLTINRPNGEALYAARLSVGGNINLDQNFVAYGEVHLTNARVGTLIDLTHARLHNPGGPALTAEQIEVGRTVRLHGALIDGAVNFARATVGSEIDLSTAEFAGNPGELSLVGARVPSLNVTATQPPDMLDLRYAKVGVFIDDPVRWPRTIRLRDFSYDALAEDVERGRKMRLRWLTRDADPYVPQPYEQLAATYRRAGHEDAARHVAIARRIRQRIALGPVGRCWNWLLYITVGYGYRTWQAALWLVGLIAVGAVIFSASFPDHFLRRSNPAPAFQPVAYAVDVLIPLTNLGQRDAWQPMGAAQYWSWGLTVAGWVLTTAVAAGLTAVLKRE